MHFREQNLIIQKKIFSSSLKTFLITFFLFIFSVYRCCAAENLIYNLDELLTLRDSSSEAFESFIKLLIQQADKYLDFPCHSVMDKTALPPSNDKHDYISLARYWWPDTKKGNSQGLPYIRKDGLINPEIWENRYDYNRKLQMTESCKTLSLAYFFTQDERYAKQAAATIKAWFIDPTTRMNPHLTFAQGIPGRLNGRAAGIIESSQFPSIFDAVRLLKGSPYWNAEDQTLLENWIKEYLVWLLESPNGQKEALAANNQGSWYDYQVIYYALYTGQNVLARTFLVEHVLPRLKNQFTPSNQQTHELTRTKSFFYCYYNLHALYLCAILGEHCQMDFWHFTVENRIVLQATLDCLLEYATGQKPWINQDIEAIDPTLLTPLLIMAAKAYDNSKYIHYYYQIMRHDLCLAQWKMMCPSIYFPENMISNFPFKL